MWFLVEIMSVGSKLMFLGFDGTGKIELLSEHLRFDLGEVSFAIAAIHSILVVGELFGTLKRTWRKGEKWMQVPDASFLPR